jgi:hypothetical protein
MRGSGRDVTVQADSAGEARRVVMEMFAGALVTSVSGVGSLPFGQLLQDQDVFDIKTRLFIFLAAAKKGSVPKNKPKGGQLLNPVRV